MPNDQEPIPPEALPPGWGPADHGEERIAYRHGRLNIELSAAQTEGAQSHPSLGLPRCWELRFEYDIGELAVSDSICRVSTQHAAVKGLLECMGRIQKVVGDTANDPMEVQSALDGVHIDNVVPCHLPSPSSRRFGEGNITSRS